MENVLLRVLRDPQELARLSIPEWDDMLRMARLNRVSGHLRHAVADRGLEPICPPTALDMLQAARYYPDHIQAVAREEIRHLRRSLDPLKIPMILLKGAAYMAARLPVARGRPLSDVDILVPRRKLEGVELQLLADGWEPQKLDSYDQRYYREWMHEIPPLRHPERGIEVDIHHTLLPITARLTPDPSLLWEASVPLGEGNLRVLAPTDMVLHSAAHLFYDGEIAGALRDLVDLHQLFQHFGTEPGFWESLPKRAEALQLARPLYYALRYCRRLLETPIPAEVLDYAERSWAPPLPVRWLMDRLVTRVLTPRLPEERDPAISAWLLYVRSHWLRMPPWLLASHLSRKGWRRMRERLGGS